MKQGLSTRFPLAIRDDPSVPWVITNKAVRELGLKLQDEVALADLQKQLAAPVARVRVLSQAAILNIPDVDQPPELAFSVQERVMFLLSPDFSKQDAILETNSYLALANHAIFMSSCADHAIVMAVEELELSAHEWARRTPKFIEQALQGPLKEHWLRSINKERASLVKNEALGPAHDSPPPDVQPLGMEVRFKNKYRDMGKIKISAMTKEALDKILKTRAIVRGIVPSREFITTLRTRQRRRQIQCELFCLLRCAQAWIWLQGI